MIRDYPDVVPHPMSPTTSMAPISSSVAPSPATFISSSTSSLVIMASSAGSFFSRPAPAPPPLKHSPLSPPTVQVQMSYMRARRVKAVGALSSPIGQQTQNQVPIMTSSLQGGVTTRHPLPNGSGSSSSTVTLTSALVPTAHAHDVGPSAALLDKVRALDHLTRWVR